MNRRKLIFLLISPFTILLSACNSTDKIHAVDLLKIGEEDMQLNRHEDAILKFRKCINNLEEKYYDPSVMDDSGQVLTIAEIDEKDGDFLAASNLYHRVCSSRLIQHARKGLRYTD